MQAEASADILRLLDEGRVPEARERLEALTDDGEHDELEEAPLLGRLRIWLLERPLGPGRAAAALRAAPPVDPDDPSAAEVLCLDQALLAGEALESDRPEELVAHALEARRLLPDRSPFLQLVVVSILQAAYRLTADVALGNTALEVAGRLADRTDAAVLAVQARALRGNIRLLQGRFHEADEELGAALDLARAGSGAGAAGSLSAEGPERAMALQFRAYVRYEWNRLDEAAEMLVEAAAAGERMGSRGVRSGCYRMLARVELSRSRPEEAEGWLRRLEELVDGRASLRNREWMQGVRAGFAAATGDLRAADGWIRARGYRVGDLSEAGSAHLLGRLQELATLLDVLLALDRPDEAAMLACSIGSTARAAGRRWFAVRAGAVEAAATERLGDAARADRALAAALAEGREEAFVRVYADLGPPLLPALRRLADRDPTSGHLGRILAATEATASWRAPRPVLTPRELEVLGLLARGLSNKLIARRLDVSLATVKTHLHHLYHKLQVSSRTQAVKQAESLALL